MHNFEFYSPTKIVFGKDSEKRAGEMAAALNAKKVLVVYGSNRVEKSGLLKTVTDSLESEGIEVRTAHGIKANPTYAKAVEIIEQNREFQPDLLLAVGGGSVIDTAKAAAIALANPDHELWEIWMGKAKVSRSIPVGSVLTIPAAGSETSDSAVLTREDLELKKGLSTD
ncbi:MAG: iron-containing alcohol dehydrogenase, partial [Ileibacterium sp.]|nr:iron-containing alcohol dehydrogenase [Ileibacterium sp.]